MEAALQGEVESLREGGRREEEARVQREEREGERWERREEMWKARVQEAEAALATSGVGHPSPLTITSPITPPPHLTSLTPHLSPQVRAQGLREQVVLLEGQAAEAVQLNSSMVGERSMSGEVADLQAAHLELLADKQALEHEVTKAKCEVEEVHSEGRRWEAKCEALGREVEEAQCSVVGYCRQVERGREEVEELAAQLEAERQGRLEQGGRGNSLFSEVEDRREKVEGQLKVFEDKFSLLKANYDARLRELQKTKVHNAALLGLVGARGGEGQVERMEELLDAERRRNRELSERLDALEEGGRQEQVVVVVKEGEEGGGHTASEEYRYLAALVADLQARLARGQAALARRDRQGLEDSQRVRELTRKVGAAEVSLKRSQAENYSLRMAVDEMKAKKGDQKVAKKETKMVVEMLKFDEVEEDKAAEAEVKTEMEEVFVLKETVVNSKDNQDRATPPPPPIDDVIKDKEDKENKTKEEKPKKKCAMFSDTVEVVGEEGAVAAAVLREGEGGKVRGRKVQGRKQGGRAVVAQEAEECKQQ